MPIMAPAATRFLLTPAAAPRTPGYWKPPTAPLWSSAAITAATLPTQEARSKPWAAVPSPAGAASAGQPGISNPNPLQDIELLFNSDDFHNVGTQVVNGVSTTEYQGSYPASDALKGLKPSEIKSIGSSIHGPIDETVWIDGQHQLRRVTTTEHVSSVNIVITMNITQVNVPLTGPDASDLIWYVVHPSKAEAQKDLAGAQKELAEAQKQTDRSLKALIKSLHNGRNGRL